MRHAPLLAVLLAAPALCAQPDPTTAGAYEPLTIGTVREYRLADQGGTTVFGYRRETVVRDTLIAGETWRVRRDQTFSAARARTSDVRRVLRFDAAAANVVERSASGDVSALYPCRLDLDLTGSGFPACTVGVSYSKRPGTVLGVVTTLLTFGYDFGSIGVAAGFGLVSMVHEGVFTSLVYARIGSREVGTRVDGLPFRPDLTPAEDYYPLEVGNEWVFRYTERSVNGTSDVYVRRRVLREAVIGRLTYAVDQTCIYNNLAATPAWACEPERLVRFDPATMNVFVGSASGESIHLCNLGADFDTRSAPSSPCGGFGYYGYQPSTVEIGGTMYTVPSIKVPRSLANVAPPVLIAGIGQTPSGTGAFQTSSFEFARVRGVEYGVRPVAGESGATPDGALALTSAPNPTSGALRLAITLPEAETVTAEAFDALGRRVWQQTAALGAGSQTFDVDASAWAPGVYVVRATAGRATATARVVRR